MSALIIIVKCSISTTCILMCFAGSYLYRPSLLVLSDKLKRFLQEFYTEDDNGKKAFKYGVQLVSR